MAREVFPRLVRCAAALLGGERQLARYLAVDVAEVERWLHGTAIPPHHLHPRLSGLLARDLRAVAADKVVGTDFRLSATNPDGPSAERLSRL